MSKRDGSFWTGERHRDGGLVAVARLSLARKAALTVLDEARRRDGYVRELLDGARALEDLDARDAGLARRLALGVTAAQGCLDELLDRFLAKPRKVAPRVRIALRITTFELLYLGTPAEAAVSQGVELARAALPAASGLANAVLRNVAAAADSYLAAEDVPGCERPLAAAARRAGLPVWLAREIEASLGTASSSLFAAELEPAPIAGFALQGAEASNKAATALPGCITPVDVREEHVRRALVKGSLVISDAHAQLIATAAARSGSCLEIGAGRGTKTYIMQEQARRAGFEREHIALDLYEGKCRKNKERLEQAGLAASVRTFAGDACDLDAALADLDSETGKRRLFDTVFVDAPCSGTGTMRRHPEIPWRLTKEDVNRNLPELQLSMLAQAAARVIPGGELLYATCSVLKQENDNVVDAFLSSPQGKDFKPVPLSEADIFQLPAFKQAVPAIKAHESAKGRFQTIPAPAGFDGHFCARFIKVI